VIWKSSNKNSKDYKCCNLLVQIQTGELHKKGTGTGVPTGVTKNYAPLYQQK
jgi:hypothetical protein